LEKIGGIVTHLVLIGEVREGHERERERAMEERI
jgi:hypothetical protein